MGPMFLEGPETGFFRQTIFFRLIYELVRKSLIRFLPNTSFRRRL